MVITIETLGDERFVRGFNRIPDDVKDLSVPFAEIYRDFTLVNHRNFLAQGYPLHWVPLSPQYAAWKQKHFPGLPILVRSGEMRDSLASTGAGMGPGAIREIHARDAWFGTSVRYARFHQTGTRRMPRRKPVQLADEDKVRWGRIIHRWFVGAVKAALKK